MSHRRLVVTLMVAAIVFGVIYSQMGAIRRKLDAVRSRRDAVRTVLKGAGLLSMSTLLRDDRLGFVNDIVCASVQDGVCTGLVVVSNKGAAYADVDGRVREFTSFDTKGGTMHALDVDGDGRSEFVSLGDAYSQAELIDHDGRTVWYWPGGTEVCKGMAYGHVLGDGQIGFVAASDAGTLAQLGLDGRVIWRQQLDRDAEHVEIVTPRGEDTPCILYSNQSDRIMVRDTHGKALRSFKVPSEQCFSFSLCRWPVDSGHENILVPWKGRLYVVDTNGVVLANLEARGARLVSDVWGVPMRLSPRGPECLAVLESQSPSEPSYFYIYDSHNQLIYEEKIGGWLTSIAAIPISRSGEEAILLGGKHQVWQYRATGR